MTMYIVIELCLVLILLLIIIISALQGWLDKQLPLCRTITYVGIIVLTILDLVYNNSNTKIGIGMAVIISSIFEIVSNLKLNFEISKNTIIYTTLVGIGIVSVPLIFYCLLKTSVLVMIINKGHTFWKIYGSALIGAFATLFGIRMTIKHENKIRREEYIEKIRPVLSSKYVRLTLDDLKALRESNGLVLEISAEKAGNGEAYDSETFEEYARDEEVVKKYKFIMYTVSNTANYSANKVSIRFNGEDLSSNISLLPHNEINILLKIHLEGTGNNSRVTLVFEYEYEDIQGKRRYKQEDKLEFFKNEDGKICNSNGYSSISWPEKMLNCSKR